MEWDSGIYLVGTGGRMVGDFVACASKFHCVVELMEICVVVVFVYLWTFI